MNVNSESSSNVFLLGEGVGTLINVPSTFKRVIYSPNLKLVAFPFKEKNAMIAALKAQWQNFKAANVAAKLKPKSNRQGERHNLNND